MYYPYLRGKQFELIALRDISEKYPECECLCPIIEPVKYSFNGLTTAVKKMFDNEFKFALILNPMEGEFKRGGKDILSEIPELEESKEKWTPAFLFQNNLSIIKSIIEEKALTDVMIIFKDGVDTEDDVLFQFLDSEVVSSIVTGHADSRIEMRKLRGLGKKLIRLDNCFNTQARNADYSISLDEKFTEQHTFYDDEDFFGFSDYTAMTNKFIEGGMLPYAVAIHLVYEKNDQQLNIHHFVSDTNDSYLDVQKKFFEAASKVKTFFLDKPNTCAVKALIQLLEQEKYPGLGVLKKLSIENHLELMVRILSK